MLTSAHTRPLRSQASVAEVPIYLDFHATTPTDGRVVDAMLPWLRDHVGNPHSHTHSSGRRAMEAIERARAQIADLIGATPEEVFFTSGATEATNIVLRGAVERKRGGIVTTAIEHSCVRETADALSRRGCSTAVVNVGVDGLVQADDVAEAIGETTRIVSVMLVNNETGVIQPVGEVGSICRRAGVLFHSDAAQALGKIPLDVGSLSVDFLSLSSHKIYGPAGIGAMFCRRATRVELRPVSTGGGQERGLRPGTLPTALCVGFGEACAILASEGEAEQHQIRRLRDRLLHLLIDRVPRFHVNGTLDERVPGNLNIAFEDIDADALLARLPDVALSTGSACASAALEPSHVLIAMGIPRDLVLGSIRIAIGRQTTEQDVERASARIAQEVEMLRELTGGKPMSRRAARRGRE